VGVFGIPGQAEILHRKDARSVPRCLRSESGDVVNAQQCARKRDFAVNVLGPEIFLLGHRQSGLASLASFQNTCFPSSLPPRANRPAPL